MNTKQNETRLTPESIEARVAARAAAMTDDEYDARRAAEAAVRAAAEDRMMEDVEAIRIALNEVRKPTAPSGTKRRSWGPDSNPDNEELS